jgi:hypothetical protein
MSPRMKKTLTILLVAFAIYAVYKDPDQAAKAVGSVFDALMQALSSVADFFDALLRRI